jgi:hypothetical protein
MGVSTTSTILWFSVGGFASLGFRAPDRVRGFSDQFLEIAPGIAVAIAEAITVKLWGSGKTGAMQGT